MIRHASGQAMLQANSKYVVAAGMISWQIVELINGLFGCSRGNAGRFVTVTCSFRGDGWYQFIPATTPQHANALLSVVQYWYTP